jgi:hypothetical protein
VEIIQLKCDVTCLFFNIYINIALFLFYIEYNLTLKFKKQKKMTVLKIQKLHSPQALSIASSTDYYGFPLVFMCLLVIGTIGNIFVVSGYSYRSSFKKHTTYSTFIILAIIHLVLLYMSAFDFIRIDFISRVFLESKFACSAYNVVYRSFLLLEPW